MTDKIIEITPELNRRVQAERRREPRERIEQLERENKELREVCTDFLAWLECESNTASLPIADVLRKVLKGL